ncbi:MAG: hypothetical protein L6R30_10470 [Thermoanaerobaculia bacterium]|nr:hypothetical protein [Thermoanaerobaculia bacterium]
MDEPRAGRESAPSAVAGPGSETLPAMGRTLMHVAWMSIVLGLILEVTVLIVSTASGKPLAARPILADVVQKVSWSVIVCIGLALGRGASRVLATGGVAVTGLSGLIAAPLAFTIARSLHEGAQEALFIKVFAGGGGSPILLVLIKGLEYGCLGALFAWLSKRESARAGSYAGAGLVTGIVFGAAILASMFTGKTPPPPGALISRALNELINPVGCALTLYAAEVLGRSRPGGASNDRDPEA